MLTKKLTLTILILVNILIPLTSLELTKETILNELTILQTLMQNQLKELESSSLYRKSMQKEIANLKTLLSDSQKLSQDLQTQNQELSTIINEQQTLLTNLKEQYANQIALIEIKMDELAKDLANKNKKVETQKNIIIGLSAVAVVEAIVIVVSLIFK